LDDAAGPGAAAFLFMSMCLLYFVDIIAGVNRLLLQTGKGFWF
jgi:hypothetical protein